MVATVAAAMVLVVVVKVVVGWARDGLGSGVVGLVVGAVVAVATVAVVGVAVVGAEVATVVVNEEAVVTVEKAAVMVGAVGVGLAAVVATARAAAAKAPAAEVTEAAAAARALEVVALEVAAVVAVPERTCDRRPVALNVPAARAGAVGAAHRHDGPARLQHVLGDLHLLGQPDALSAGGRLRPEVNGAVIAAVRQEEQTLGSAGRLLPHRLGAQDLLARAVQRGGRAQCQEHPAASRARQKIPAKNFLCPFFSPLTTRSVQRV